MHVEGLLSLLCLMASSLLLVRALRPGHLAEACVTLFVCFAGQVTLLAYVLSGLESLHSLLHWLAGSAVLLAAACGAAIPVLRRAARNDSAGPDAGAAGGNAPPLDAPGPASRLRLGAMTTTVALCGAANLLVVVLCAPGTWDSMSYHLARVAYYLQQGSFAAFDANYWAQVVHPVNSAALSLFAYVVTGSENLVQIVQFLSYWAALFAVHGITATLGASRRTQLCAALVFGLLITCLMEASTAQNDMLLAAYIGGAALFVLAFRRSREGRKLVLAGICIGLALGVKASALLAVPSLAVLAAWALAGKRGQRRAARGPQLAAAALAAAGILVFTLPAGYVRNISLFNHPAGPVAVRAEHTFEGQPPGRILAQGGANALRYGFEFLSLDGLPASGAVEGAQAALTFLPRTTLNLAGLDLESGGGSMREPFSLSKPPASHEDRSYWGILGFALVLPIAFLVLIRVVKPPSGWILAAAGLLYFLAQSFSGPYDPWRGRYFIVMAIFLAPLAGLCVEGARRRVWSVYATAIVLAGCLAALTAVTFREKRPLLPAAESVFSQSRSEQVAANRRRYLKTLRYFETIVPADAVVALCLEPNSYEYPLFGRGLTRRLIPINSYQKGVQPIPPEAEYLLYNSSPARPSVYFDGRDILLGRDWLGEPMEVYLRRLENRKQ